MTVRSVDLPSHLRPLHNFIVFADERIIETKKQCYAVRITGWPNAPPPPPPSPQPPGRTMLKTSPLISGGRGGGWALPEFTDPQAEAHNFTSSETQ